MSVFLIPITHRERYGGEMEIRVRNSRAGSYQKLKVETAILLRVDESVARRCSIVCTRFESTFDPSTYSCLFIKMQHIVKASLDIIRIH